jgi:hypothetical protein
MVGVKFYRAKYNTEKILAYIRAEGIPLKMYGGGEEYSFFTPEKEWREMYNEEITNYANNHCKI